ncbi:hypothetical protein K6U06_10705 [Acidiferrimicrobium sp. IK]|uniref:hypothetical protein n=1 Tax=Acidiferrimicrobium sp. IK TaxID=2871700 RepID=UPI0021CB6AD8|nr:hypothetical protein [Acidiferrimicrobium sp. IK]MCU4184829.1 hypothetical protein [Acidiferrimicrobium sp. IK]
MNRKLAGVFGLVVVVLVAAWYSLLWAPATHSAAKADQQLVTATNNQFQASMQRAALVGKEKLLPGEAAKAAALDAAAPAGSDIAGMIDQVSSIATASGVTWQAESQSQAPASSTGAASSGSSSAGGASGSSIGTLSVTLSVTGTYNQLLDFVTRLQSAPRLIKVTSLALGASAGTSSAATSGAPSSATTSSGGNSVMTTQVSATMFETAAQLPAAPKSLK